MNSLKDNCKTPVIRDLPPAERPREKLMSQGVFSLSDSELIAVLLGSGSSDTNAIGLANRLLARETSLSDFSEYRPEEFMSIPGIGPAKACSLSAAIELGRRISSVSPTMRPLIDSPEKAAAVFMEEMRYLKHETFRVAMLNVKGELIMKDTVSVGTLNSASAHPRDVFREAIRKGASAVILCHNHPSGDPTPSGADISMTHQLSDAGKILGISVEDHIVIGNGKFFSFRKEGLIFSK